jgi:hypothetical protein
VSAANNPWDLSLHLTKNIHAWLAGIIDASLKKTLLINFSFVKVALAWLLNCRCSGSGNVMVSLGPWLS